MLVGILLFAVVACAVALLASRISIMALLCFMDEKGYIFPTDTEMKKYCRKVTEKMFRRR